MRVLTGGMPRYYPSRCTYLENSLMAREMDRL